MKTLISCTIMTFVIGCTSKPPKSTPNTTSKAQAGAKDADSPKHKSAPIRRTFKQRLVVEGAQDHSPAVFSPNENVLVYVGKEEDRPVTLDLKAGRKLPVAFPEDVYSGYGGSLSYSHDGSLLLYAFNPAGVAVWDAKDLSKQPTLLKPVDAGPFCKAAISKDRKTIAVAYSDDKLRIWNRAKKSVSHTLTGHTGNWITHIAFSPDNKRLVSVSSEQVIIWLVNGWKKEATIVGGSSLAILPDGTSAVIGRQQEIAIVGLKDGKTLRTLKCKNITSAIAITADGRIMASGDHEGHVTLWDLRHEMQVTSIRPHKDTINTLAFSRSGTLLVTGAMEDNGMLMVWNVTTPPPK